MSKSSTKTKYKDKVEQLQHVTLALQHDLQNEEMQFELHETKLKLQCLQQIELENIQQHTHVGWIIEGGTSFFARVVKLCRARNFIYHTLDNEGTQIASLHEMKLRTSTYFTNLFACETHPPPIQNLDL